MKDRFLTVLLILNLGFLVMFNKKLEVLELQVNKLSTKRMSKAETELKTKVIAKEMKERAKSVLSVRCQDSSKATKEMTEEEKKKVPKKWHGTAVKVGDNLILTADHLISKYEEKNRVLPIDCKFFQRGSEVGVFNTQKNSYKQVGQKDIVLLQVEFNAIGKKILSLNPEVYTELSVGENLVLITHPKNMINDYLITFGMVLNDDTENLLTGNRKDYWKNSIITDMTAAPGSSGSPLFTLDGRLIGLHVGGEREGLQANYQMIFDGEFYLNLQMARLLNWGTKGKE